MPAPIQVAILGFSAFERNAVASHFKIAPERGPRFTMVLDIDSAMFVIADADQPGVTELLRELGRIDDAVFVGASAPPEAAAWMMRPIDPANVMRELDRMLSQHDAPSSRPIPLGLPSGPGALWPPGSGTPPPTARVPARRADDLPPPPAADAGQRARRSDAPAPLPATVRRSRPTAPSALPVRRALLVDDSEIALHFLRRLLESYDIPTDFAYDSTEAFELLAMQAYGIAFLDVDLGEGSELDGLTLCKRIKARQVTLAGRQPLLVLVSAYHDGVHQARGTLAGADAYLAKPLDRAALERLLASLGLPAIGKAPLRPT